jgi:ribosomal protein L7/L12
VSIGAVKLTIPIDAATSLSTPRSARNRNGAGQFETKLPQLSGLDAAPATAFDVTLLNIGANKIDVIREVRAFTALGLREAKDLVEDAPTILKEDVSWSEAERIWTALEKVGATVSLGPKRRRGNGQSLILPTMGEVRDGL